MTVVVGVDPGGRETGIVGRDGPRLLWHAVVTRSTTGPFPDADYLLDVEQSIMARLPDGPVVLAVEGLVEPNPHMGLTNVRGLIGAAMVLGAVLSEWPDARVIPPNRHGQAPRQAYPDALIGPREGAALTGVRRHVRAAWDIAGSPLARGKLAR